MRSLIAFDCEGETLVGTCDGADGNIGLVIVSGGSEIRSGAHRGMALLAQKLADRGIPVFRYDRRGIGDSTGLDQGFRSAEPDLDAAVKTFRATVPNLVRIVGFGNCDAASALAMFGENAGLDAVILANPWITEDPDDLPPAAAIRRRYGERLRDRSFWAKLAKGGIDIRNIIRGLRKISRKPSSAERRLRQTVFAAIDRWAQRATILIATRDATGLTFAESFERSHERSQYYVTFETGSHSFAGSENAARLETEIVAALRRV